MPVRMKLPVLPVYYYHDHFTEIKLFFVSEIYGPVLTERHRVVRRDIQDALKADAQCLLIRMINRRGTPLPSRRIPVMPRLPMPGAR